MKPSITIEAAFENGVFRPLEPLTEKIPAKVRIIVQVPESSRVWPANVAEIYQDLEDEDRKRANEMWQYVQETWPTGE